MSPFVYVVTYRNQLEVAPFWKLLHCKIFSLYSMFWEEISASATICSCQAEDACDRVWSKILCLIWWDGMLVSKNSVLTLYTFEIKFHCNDFFIRKLNNSFKSIIVTIENTCIYVNHFKEFDKKRCVIFH